MREAVTLYSMGMLLQRKGLIKELSGSPLDGQAVIENLTCDSREAGPGTLFICKGAGFSENYLREAADKGSIAYISEYPMDVEANPVSTVTGIAGGDSTAPCARQFSMDIEAAREAGASKATHTLTAGTHGASSIAGASVRPHTWTGGGGSPVVSARSQSSGNRYARYRTPTKPKLTGLIVTDIRMAMAVASAHFYGYEPEKPMLTGITGTKGKTTTAWYLKAMLDEWVLQEGEPETGLISTVSDYDGVSRTDAQMTTPEAPTLHRHLANAREAGLKYLTMEVSSQALKYKRVRGLTFDVGIFLNISEDHISPKEHEDFDDYFSSKLSLFRQTKTAVVNLGSEHSAQILKAARKAERIVTFGRSPKADLRITDVHLEMPVYEGSDSRAETEKFSHEAGAHDSHEKGLTSKNRLRKEASLRRTSGTRPGNGEDRAFQKADTEQGRLIFQASCKDFTETFSLAMRGTLNVDNAAAAIAAAWVYGVPVSCMKRALAKTYVPGRMETFTSRDGELVAIVDFAHNKLSYERLFDTAFAEYGSYKNIITIFGCPGGKAYNRRRELGILAGMYSDEVYITSDDPGAECQEDIAREVHKYVDLTGCPCREVAEREKAIREATRDAAFSGKKSLLLVLGRGTEKYQQVGAESIAYPTDSEMVKMAIEEYDRTGRRENRII